MKATDLLEKQHRTVEKLFEQFENARSDGQKRDIFEKIAQALVAHDAIEREIFYPACQREVRGAEDLLEESIVEHGLVEFSIFRADKNRSNGQLEAYVKVLQDIVEHHVEEEEKELLPNVNRQLSKRRNETLGVDMEARFHEAMEEDFRKPLRNNVNQVIAGRTKTTPAPKRTVAKARAAGGVKRARAATPRKRTTARRVAR